MSNAIFRIPKALNEPVKGYAPGSPERKALKQAIADLKAISVDIPMFIGGKEVRTGKTVAIHPPHEIAHTLGHYHQGGAEHVKMAIDAALTAKQAWENTPWEDRAAIFLKAAELLAGPYRYKMNAATMLGQSKNPFQAEIDSACELIDFWRFNAEFMQQVYSDQPESAPGIWNRMEHRALEGFVFALSPFNFTSIGGNLPTAPAMMGNTVVWKTSNTQIYSAWVIMEILREAGLPDGVINLVHVSGSEAGKVIFSHPDFAGIHFTGSTEVFRTIWKTIGDNIHVYKTYPRIVGETGGKDFVIAHPSAHPKQVATALSRGAFEFQGQKCSAASRAYIPSNMWEEVKRYLVTDLAEMKMGGIEDFSNFINAVIDEKAFDSISGYIAKAKADGQEIIAGGTYDKSKGYFIAPTVILAKDPSYRTMCEEIFGPVLTIHVYDAEKWSETLQVVNNTSPYALTGAIFSQDRYAVVEATVALRHAAGNFYINDKPTGAVVGQQPFGGARASGTNDKAGSILNLLRWVSPRTIKENFVPPVDFRYSFLNEE
ncbi:MAG TPA: L-glutamate gamma-semialdehyde dehydrogenase [Chitinophagales bacterium]|nr:L-glutamate gamma-semialdehyde dehydrogenase [Chitinophagales bacterium]HNA56673.1 L-glutamate gamma-semialdehyde dehydrogenase [Chitinophagales bacterium]HNE45661.1 L-glutamate gamma-semialdehyde dehydrogenase [Chitinophagales bacterium]HNF68016.1 L-glutamate gamma-semialdehyde dehydrogenase [Chitinophagales bacterium]HNI53068.1 L-glutamate gamma-semialdehyde dehydrogenase [Chitinophagales bacterium]